MKALIIGGSGQLGHEILTRWTGDELTAPRHAELDIEDRGSVDSFLERGGFDLVVNCAAFHNVDTCEREPERAFAVNALAVDALASSCEKHGATFVTVSTDYVFSGEAGHPYAETDCPHPLSAYGISKLAGELLVLRRKMKAFVVRTCGVYGRFASQSKGYTFVDRIISQARKGEEIRVVSDVVASPTYAGHLADALRSLVDTDAYGVVHAANRGPVTWYEFASKALELAGIDHPIEPISAAAWKAPARRPAYSALENERLNGLGIAMPAWDEGIAAYLRDKAR